VTRYHLAGEEGIAAIDSNMEEHKSAASSQWPGWDPTPELTTEQNINNERGNLTQEHRDIQGYDPDGGRFNLLHQLRVQEHENRLA
jgi:hypothetical protein